MDEQAKRANGGAFRKSRRLRWIIPGLLVSLYILLVVSGHGVLFCIQNTTLPPGANGPYGVFPTFRCHYFAGTRTFRLHTSIGFGGEGIHSFAFPFLVGVIAGTYSTVYIAAPVLLWLSGEWPTSPTQAEAAA